MKIYTRRGDRGETDLFGGARVAKDHLRVQAYGDVDELTSCLGVAAAAGNDQGDLQELLVQIQSVLMDLGAHLATPSRESQVKGNIPELGAEDIQALEVQVDRLEAELEPLKSFILPGGSAAAAALHHARTVCRRAERSAVSLDREETLDGAVMQYLNRLSDLLFVMARTANHRSGIDDVAWVARRRSAD